MRRTTRSVLLLAMLATACGSHGSDETPADASTTEPTRDAGTDAHADAAAPARDGGLLPDGAAPPTQACKTHYLDTSTYLAGYDDPQWYIDNIPFLDVPDTVTKSHIQKIYYYRFSTLKRALRYTDAANGYVFLEFLEPPGYAAAFGAVNAAAGHHLYEARWLHDTRYGDDYLNYWLNGAGKANVRQYSFWVADSTFARYQVSGDAAFAKALLPQLIANYEAWGDHYDASMGLYWQTPVWDAMEYMGDSYSTQNPDKDPYHGGDGFRPTINAYQFADARAIASLSRTLASDTATAATYESKATALVKAMEAKLWVPSSNFFVHRYRDGGALFDAGGGREEIGFVPWQFEMPEAGYEASWKDTITSTSVFRTAYGPTTLAKDNPYYLNPYARGACCHWNGPLWPYSTTQTLKAMANLLNDYQQTYVTAADYFDLLESFARSQFKNGEPYIAEALDPDDTKGAPIWAYDSPGHSEHYNHSGFVDPVITGLIGLHPSSDDHVHVSPLAPAAWDHFMLENVSYHGHYVTIVWDADGKHYDAGPGFSIIQDCQVIHHQDTIGSVDVPLVSGTWPPAKKARPDNVFSNAANKDYPKASASYTFGGDSVDQVNDGLVIYDRSVNGSVNNVSLHNRWTSYGSPNAQDWVRIDLGAAKKLDQITLHIYADGAGVTPPTGYTISSSSDNVTFTPVSNGKMTPAKPVAGPNVVTFDPVSNRYFRVTFDSNIPCTKGSGCVGLTELEAWVTP